MSFDEYIKHYTDPFGVLGIILVSTTVVCLMAFLLMLRARYVNAADIVLWEKAGKPEDILPPTRSEEFLLQLEMYCEMLFAATAMLFFVGLYFLIDYQYFPFPDEFYVTWEKYDDFLLLLALVFAILMIDLLDHFVVPLRNISSNAKGALRASAMLYMLIIFAYIKFIYDDDNYDAIIVYFIIMIIGRFIYFDVSIHDFTALIKGIYGAFPILAMVLGTTGIMALYGFFSGYLLWNNGVVVSLWIAHLFVILEICVLVNIWKLRAAGSKAVKQNED